MSADINVEMKSTEDHIDYRGLLKARLITNLILMADMSGALDRGETDSDAIAAKIEGLNFDVLSPGEARDIWVQQTQQNDMLLAKGHGIPFSESAQIIAQRNHSKKEDD